MSRWWPLLLAVATIATQAPGWRSPDYDDDWRHRHKMDQVIRGETTLPQFLFARHNEHLLPLWKAWAYVTYRTWGRHPLPWHMAISLAHFVGTVALVIVLRLTMGMLHAVTAGFLWAGAALGNFDAPHVWVAASHATFGVTFWLVASAAATGFASRVWPLALLGVTAAWMAALGSMVALVVLTPALLFQLWRFEFPRIARAPFRKACFLIAVLLPASAGIFAQVVAPPDVEDAHRNAPRSASVAAAGTGLVFLASLGNMVLPPSVMLGTSQDHAWHALVAAPRVAWIGAVAAVAMIAVVWRRRREWKAQRSMIVWAFLAAVPWTVLACYSSSDDTPLQLASHGRYRLPATLFWAVAVSSLPAALPPRVLAVLGVGYLALQAVCTEAAVRQITVMHEANYPTAASVFGFKD